jgi:hypothetical protein
MMALLTAKSEPQFPSVVLKGHAENLVEVAFYINYVLPDIPFHLHDFALACDALKRILACPRECALDQHPPV